MDWLLIGLIGSLFLSAYRLRDLVPLPAVDIHQHSFSPRHQIVVFLAAQDFSPTTVDLKMTLEDVAWKAYELFSAPSSFQRLDNPVFSDKLRDLRNIFHRLQLSDLKYDEAKLNRLKKKSDMIWYMSIVDHEEDEMLEEDQEDTHTPAAVMTIAAFLLKPGAHLPIHDHPKMYGMMKVLHGQLKLQSYSSVKCLDSTSKGRMPQLLVRKSDVK